VIEQPLDLRRIRLILRRYRTVLVAVTLLGALLGLGLSALRPPLRTSTALVLLPPPATTSSGTSLRDMPTQIRIASGQEILSSAAKTLSPPETDNQVKSHVKVTAPTDQVISIRASARNSHNAEALANGVATGYVAYANSQSSAGAAALKGELQKAQAALTKQINTVQGQINTTETRLAGEVATSHQASNDHQLLLTLQASQRNNSTLKTSLAAQLAQANNNSAEGISGARVFQKATTATKESLVRHIGTFAVGGALLAFLLGAAMTVLISRRGRKPRLRDEIAEAVGAPVLASVGARLPKNTAHPEELTRHLRADVMNAWSIRRALEEMGAFDPLRTESLCLSFLTLEDDHDAFAVGPQFALLLASHGIRTTVETTRTENWVIQLRAMLTLERRASGDDEPTGLAPVRVALAAVDRQEPEVEHPLDPTITILALTPGSATVTELARIALASIDAGHRIDGILVANPEPADGTIGRLSQPLIGQRAPMPNRMNGTTDGPWR
jgi:capsular polysaccharide biosynthesis protein